MDPDLSTTTVHEEAKLSRLSVRRKAHVFQFTFKLKSNTKLLLRRCKGCVTRSSNKILFKVRKPATEKYIKCLSYYGLRLWTTLTVDKKINFIQSSTEKLTHLQAATAEDPIMIQLTDAIINGWPERQWQVRA